MSPPTKSLRDQEIRRGGGWLDEASRGRGELVRSVVVPDGSVRLRVELEPWKPENPLFGLDNVVITPHAAYYSDEAIHTVRDFAAHEVVRVLTGRAPLSPVNAAQLAIIQPRRSS